MTDWAPKRFWKSEQVVATDQGYGVELDGRRVRTPAKRPLVVPTEGLAKAIAAEWAQQDSTIDPATMPITRTANSAIDKVKPQQAEVAQMLAAYADADLVCYRAVEPVALAQRQAQAWDPLLKWAEQELGAHLNCRSGVMHVPQDPTALAILSDVVHQMPSFELAGFHDLVCISGSLVIGLAATRNHLPETELWEAATIDENWQSEQWGEDDEARDALIRKRDAFFNAADFYRLASGKT